MSRPKNYKLLSHYTYSLPGLGGMFGLLFWFIVGCLLGALVMALLRFIMSPDAAINYGLIIAYPIQFIPAMLYASSQSRNNSINYSGVKLDSNHFGKSGGILLAVLVSLATLAASFCTDAIVGILPQMPEALQNALEAATQGPLWANLLCVAVFAPFFEEWLCRGMVLRGLLNRGYKPVPAIVISALFFALIHGNPWQAIPGFLIGLLLGYVYYKTGSIKLTMLMHCVNNAFAVIMSHTDKFKDIESWMDVLAPSTYWIVFAACILLVALVIKKFSEIPLERPEGNMDKVASLFEQ